MAPTRQDGATRNSHPQRNNTVGTQMYLYSVYPWLEGAETGASTLVKKSQVDNEITYIDHLA